LNTQIKQIKGTLKLFKILTRLGKVRKYFGLLKLFFFLNSGYADFSFCNLYNFYHLMVLDHRINLPKYLTELLITRFVFLRVEVLVFTD